jgi:Zn-dependent metalloprotease
MPSLRGSAWLLSLVLAASATASHAAAPVRPDDASIVPLRARAREVSDAKVQQALSRGAAWTAFQKRHGDWRAVWNERTATPHRAYGPGIRLALGAGDAPSVDRALRTFVAGNPALFGGVDDLELAQARRVGDLWYVRYRQKVAGVPVLDSDWEFRVGAQGKLVMFGADAHRASPRLVTTPRVPLAVAREAAKRGLDYDPAQDRVEDGTGLWIKPYETSVGVDYRLVWDVRVRTAHPPGNWITLVDAHSGEILERRNHVLHAISGNVTATVHPNLPSETISTQPIRDVYVNVMSQTWTDASGFYTQNASGSVNVTSALRGRFVDVNRCTYSGGDDICPSGDASFSRATTNPSTVNIAWSSSNSHQSERDAFYHVTRAHSYVKTIDPAFVGCDYEIVANVERGSGDCNAYWDGTLNFYAAASPCPATAQMPDLVYHEYGHAINDNLYVDEGQPFGMQNFALQEALADVNAAFLQDNPVMGKGLYGVGTSLRTLDNMKSWPQDQNPVSPHETGLILSGALWDLRESVGVAIAGNLAHFAKYGTPDDFNDGVAFAEYFLEVLIADDDDANLSNGTPHYAAIVAAFNAHGIGTNYFVNVAVVVEDQPTFGPFPINAVITYSGTVGALDVTSPTLFYSVNNSSFTSTPMFPTGNPDEYGAQVPSHTSAVIRYYITASTDDGGVKLDPAGAPTFRLHRFLGGPYVNVIETEFDADAGWTVGAAGDGATAGVWTRVDPVGTAIQPENDHTEGGTHCYVTGNATPLDGIGVADVDGGKTTLTSPTFNAVGGGMIRPAISYWRWFSNNAGDNPGQDPWKVEISNNGGGSWVTVENTLVSDASWQRRLFFITDYLTPTNNMRLRFVATDDGTFPSLVEAAVDDFTLYAFPPSVDVGPPVAGPAFDLAPPSPNPFRGTTTLRYRLAARGPVSLRIFDVQGRTIRDLVAVDQAAGEHAATWDGRDGQGRLVPNGPYFARLIQGGQRAAEAVVVMR